MEPSILTSTKKILGIASDYTAFDLDVMTHINTAFSTLTQLGVGPANGFMIEDASAVWSDFIPTDDNQFNAVKTYVYLRVREIFDPPGTSYLIASFERQIQELEWRLNVHREETDWVDPDPDTSVLEEGLIDFGDGTFTLGQDPEVGTVGSNVQLVDHGDGTWTLSVP